MMEGRREEEKEIRQRRRGVRHLRVKLGNCGKNGNCSGRTNSSMDTAERFGGAGLSPR